MSPNDASMKRLKPAPHVTFQQLGEEVVLLDLEREQYFSLDGVGVRVWQWIVEDTPIAEIEARLIDGYDAPAETVRADLARLLDQLEGAGLVVVSPRV